MAHFSTFIVNSVNEKKFSKFSAGLVASVSTPYEIIRINDARSMAEGLNRGASKANGDILIFCHDDIDFVTKEPIAKVVRDLNYYDIAGVAGTERLVSGNWYDAGQPYLQGSILAPSLVPGKFELQVFGQGRSDVFGGTKALDGVFIACRRETFEKLGGFDAETFNSWHGYDIDFTFRGYLAGAKLCVTADILLYHDSHPATFSEEKLNEYAAAQALIFNKFSNELDSEPGVRTHTNIEVSNWDEAVQRFYKSRKSFLECS
ncbi:glycosyltransferase [Phyllobacterium meliloti]|uniref:glycosyltransferase n=1 Tax=Phyllobacterium meliloti TaxID=555317 RepID=UPI001D149639|nr:glycosyltransferase [Phyllobacterium sp. T1293]UGX87681.1 glycosyltransferase family protein [Phyllobacterium sp. T1293]